MLTLNTAQVSALDAISKARFKETMVEHLGAYSPFTLKVAKREGIEALVDEGVEAAIGFGLIHAGPARLYLELCCLFGPGFVDDPLTPWAGPVLRDPRHPDDVDRAFLLKRAAEASLRRVAGLDGAIARRALTDLRRALDRPTPRGLGAREIARTLASIYPERALEGGEDGLARLVAAGADDPACARLPADTGPLIVAGLMLAVGARATSDPRHRWIARALDHPADDAPEQRAERVRARGVRFLDAVLAELA